MSGPNPVCNCLLGYFGDNCEHCKFCNRYTNITFIISFGKIFKVFSFFQAACDTFNCQNNGSCVIQGGNATCLCHLSYTGEKCERSKNVKFNFVYYDNNVFPNKECCILLFLYIFVDICDSYCLNGGTCKIDDNDTPTCACTIGNYGKFCNESKFIYAKMMY